ncbi:hypothetical protein WMY93_031866 [Mugilogobius chulae]|uniref:Apolipoprotein F n=1 Tax=Mugilogobius chulae TaxID=88201 RepID=A0AAW0MKY5_9GOBI
MFNIKQLAQDEDVGSRCEDWAKLNGVAHSEDQPGSYQAVLKKGSRVLPSDSESWILQCRDLGSRAKRSPRQRCVNLREQRVYKIMEWIPGVSTLYNLGTAVYYASLNCSDTAKERAILTAVDLGTDALMVMTGGTAGVAGYALGAGVKTGVKAGVKYMLAKEEGDLIFNQFRWDDDSVVFQA